MSVLPLDRGLRRLGRSDLHVAPIAYGCWRLADGDARHDVAGARRKIDAALEVGVTLFDHADIYGFDGSGGFGDAESLFGRALAEAPGLRDRMVIATKGGITPPVPYDSSAAWLKRACEDSLRRLGIDAIDLYQIHRPDFLAHPAEVARALSELRDEGKIREAGVSNYTPSQTRALQAHLPFPLATSQPEFSCWRHAPLRNGTLDLCMELGITPLAWSPIGGGRLGMDRAAAAHQPGGDRLVELLDELDAVATQQNVTRGAVALAWILAHPSGAMPIIGTQRIARIQESWRALDVRLDRARWNAILVASQGEPLP